MHVWSFRMGRGPVYEHKPFVRMVFAVAQLRMRIWSWWQLLPSRAKVLLHKATRRNELTFPNWPPPAAREMCAQHRSHMSESMRMVALRKSHNLNRQFRMQLVERGQRAFNRRSAWLPRQYRALRARFCFALALYIRSGVGPPLTAIYV